MPKSVTLYKLLISCPGDVTDEIDLINKSVSKFNELYSDELGITIQTKHWSKSSYAQSGGKPQVLLNEQFINNCDAAVAVFWTKFGTPTDKYESGTEEEIELMLAAGKQVFMYFSDKPISPSQNDYKGLQKIKEFRDKYKDKGIYSTYTTNEEFQNMFFAHLSKHFLSEQRVSEIQAARRPILSLCGIDENSKLCNNLVIQPFRLNNKYTVADYKKQIEDRINIINNITIEPYENDRTIDAYFNNFIPNININLTPYEPVKFENRVISYIENVAKQFKLKLSDNFFDIGNLQRNQFAEFMGGKLEGTKQEKEKYHLIFELYEIIDELLEWIPFEKAFDKLLCFKLALKNSGTTIDEDIEICINIPSNAVLIPNDYPRPHDQNIEYLLSHYKFKTLFGIMETSEYKKYPFKESVREYLPAKPNFEYFPSIDYSKKYIDSIKNVFCYSIFQNKDSYILKLTYNYIKHNTAIAFPSPLLLKAEVSKIEYTITSKNNPEIITGTLDKL